MELCAAGLRFITREEGGMYLSPYLDAVRIPTLGVGAIHGPDGQRVTMQTPQITIPVGLAMLRRDTGDACAAVNRLVKVPLKQAQFDCLVDFTFNAGSASLQHSTALMVLNRGDYEDVPAELAKYVYAKGRMLNGLKKRRDHEAALWRSAA